MAGVRELGREITTHTEEQHKDTRLSLTKSISSVNATNQAEHKSTREAMSSQAFRATEQHETVLTRTEELVKSSEVEVIGVLSVSNQEEHEQTRSQIDELKEALRILKEQMDSRDQELKGLLKLFNSTRSTKERKKLGERSNAVTAALLALESMYRSLRVS
jgi:molybdopterin synthase catalytic subunit